MARLWATYWLKCMPREVVCTLCVIEVAASLTTTITVPLHREEESTETHGHITSLAVARSHRKLGLATKLMTAARM